MNESPNKRAIIVGLFILIGLIFLIVSILMVGNIHETFKRKMQLVSLFDDVNGLQKGNNIWFSGVKIGTVSNVNLYDKTHVLVSLDIDRTVQDFIRKDAKVKIGTDGLIGNKVLIIYGGTTAYPVVKEGDTLAVETSVSTEVMMNTLQKNNENLLAITTDFKTISKKMTNGQGTVGKLLNNDDLYNNINAATASLGDASAKAKELMNSLNRFSANLNKKGTLANELVTDTLVFNSIKSSVVQLQQMSENANAFVSNLKEASSNPKSTIGVLLHDEEAGADLKNTIKNLEASSAKLDEDLKAVQSNFLLKGYFKKKEKAEKKSAENKTP